jgi:hypothetical protein
MRSAPRPGYQIAALHYRLGLPIPQGRRVYVRGLWEYRQFSRNLTARRRRRLALYEARRATR